MDDAQSDDEERLEQTEEEAALNENENQTTWKFNFQPWLNFVTLLVKSIGVSINIKRTHVQFSKYIPRPWYIETWTKMLISSYLLFVTTATPAASSSFELTSLRPDKGFGVRVRHTWSKSEVFHCFTRFTWALHEHSLFASWSTSRQLVEGDDLSSSFQDSGAGLFRDTESAYLMMKFFISTEHSMKLIQTNKFM